MKEKIVALKSRAEIVEMLAESNYHFIMTFSAWHVVNNNSPSFIRVYKDSLREVAGAAVDKGYHVVVENFHGEYHWSVARMTERNGK